jgi:ABC-2 type transport system permease protein
MNLTGLLDKTAVIVRRDALTAIRYRAGFLLGGAGALAELAAFYYLAQAVGPGFRPDGVEYFSFLLIGTGFYTFLLMGVHAFLQTVQEAQQDGTLEVLMTTATAPPVLVFLSAMSAFLVNTVTLAFYLIMGLVFGAFLKANVLASIVVFLLSILLAVAIGLLTAAVQLAIQRGSSVVWALGSVWFLTGTLFPVATLPRWLRDIAAMIPITHALDAMRMALIEGLSLREISGKLLILTGFVAVMLPLSLAVFSWALRRARLEGTLSFY